MSPNGNFLRKQIAELFYITLGILIYSIGFCAFILPHNVVIGGMAGFSTLVFHATAYITTSYVRSVYGNGFDTNPLPKVKNNNLKDKT